MLVKRLILGVLAVGLFCGFRMDLGSNKPSPKSISVLDATIEERIFEHVTRIKALVNENQNFNKEFAFLLDMKIMSGKNRFFVYDLKNDKIIDEGLVAHGIGSGIYGELKFSNENNSFCTSLGKYFIGKSYMGEFGKAYKLYGIDGTNFNAFSREIVLHKSDKVPYGEQQKSIANSLGCPMVNEMYYRRLEKLIDKSEGYIILDIYY